MNEKRYVLILCTLGFFPVPSHAFTYFIPVNLTTNDIVYDKFSDSIYASVPSSVGALRGNTITPINPHTGALSTSVFVASEPSILALADDGSRIYVASNSTNLVTPFSLSTMTPGATFPIGNGDQRVSDMEVPPGHSNALIVSTRRSSGPQGVAAFVDGVKLPQHFENAVNNVIELDAAAMYGHYNTFSELDFNKLGYDLSPTGGVTTNLFHVKHLVAQQGLDMELQNGRMYFTNGQVLEVATPGPVGSYNGSGPVEPDASAGRTYYLTGNSLKSFSQATFVPLGSIPVPGISGSAKNLISLGAGGLAFATTGGQVIIARGSLVLGPTGDFDNDGDVDATDFLTVQAGFGVTTGASRGQGDSNGDGAVNSTDMAAWRMQFGTVGSPTSSLTPEPTSGCIALALASALISHQRRLGCPTRRLHA